MQLSVIIPTLNEGKYLEKTLECLRKQTFDDFETIIVDGNSTDNTRDIAHKYTDRVFVLKKRGVPLARNYGASKSRGKILVHTDADCALPPTWLETIQDDITNREVDMVWGPVQFDEKALIIMKLHMSFVWAIQRLIWWFAPYTMNPNIAFTKKGFQTLRGYRLDIRYLDDYDIGMRSIKNLKTYFNPNNTVIFSSRRYPTLGAIGKELIKFTKGMLEYQLMHKVSDKHVPLKG